MQRESLLVALQKDSDGVGDEADCCKLRAGEYLCASGRVSMLCENHELSYAGL